MKLILKAIAAFLAVGLAMGGAKAAPVTYYFGGNIDFASVGGLNFLVTKAFSGSFTYGSNNATDNITATLDNLQYYGGIAPLGQVKVTNGPTDIFDMFSFNGTNMFPPLSGFSTYYLALQFKDSTGTAFSSTALPGADMTLSAFDEERMYFSWLQGSSQVYAYGELDYLRTTATVPDNGCTANCNTVPEPASLALLGLGLAGIGFSRRKRQ